jgi:hypothetical protein
MHAHFSKAIYVLMLGIHTTSNNSVFAITKHYYEACDARCVVGVVYICSSALKLHL